MNIEHPTQEGRSDESHLPHGLNDAPPDCRQDQDPGAALETYRRDLSMSDLIATIRTLLDEQRRAERLVCRYLADLSDRVGASGYDLLGGFSDIYHAARCLFLMGVRSTRERLRVGRALRVLPGIEQAFVEGRISYSRVREVTRVASPEDEAQWLRLACELPMRVFERRIAEASERPGLEPRLLVGSKSRTSDPAEIRWTTPETVEVHLSLRAETWALVQRAMEGARRVADQDGLLSDDEALCALARDALAQQATTETSEVGRTVVLYECRSCGRTELETGAGPIELGDSAAAAQRCGARVRDLRTEGRVERRGGPLPRSVARAVRLRDRNRCRVPGCTRRRYVDVHHIEERSRGGVHSRSNCLCLCDTHHRMLHDGKLAIFGDAESEIQVLDAEGRHLIDPLAKPQTQGGSCTGGFDSLSAPATQAALPADATAAKLIAIMGSRGGWGVDGLCEATGLPAGAVAAALMMLEVTGHLRSDAQGRFAAASGMP